MKQCCIIILFLILVSCKEKDSEDILNNNKSIKNIPVIENKFKFLTPICKGDVNNKNSNLFYLVGGLSYLGNDQFALVDKIKRQIIIISSKDGSITKIIGRQGFGPGEFQSPYSIKKISNYGIMVYDNMQKKIVVFDDDFTYKKDIKLKYNLDDYVVIDDSTWITSEMALIQSYKPLRRFNPITEKYDQPFGEIIEIKKDIFKNNMEYYNNSRGPLFEVSGMSRIILSSDKKNIIYSQCNPYELVQYDLAKKEGASFNVSVPFSTDFGVELKLTKETRIRKILKSGSVGDPFVYETNLVVPITSADLKTCYLDVYDFKLNFIKRYKLPEFDKNIDELINFVIKDHVLYILVMNKDKLRWIERLSFED